MDAVVGCWRACVWLVSCYDCAGWTELALGLSRPYLFGHSEISSRRYLFAHEDFPRHCVSGFVVGCVVDSIFDGGWRR